MCVFFIEIEELHLYSDLKYLRTEQKLQYFKKRVKSYIIISLLVLGKTWKKYAVYKICWMLSRLPSVFFKVNPMTLSSTCSQQPSPSRCLQSCGALCTLVLVQLHSHHNLREKKRHC